VARYPKVRAENRALSVRLAHAFIAVGLAAALLLSLWLKPDPRGLGTHEQLLLLPCNFYRLTELPCPFCGMTTAFTHMARAELREALIAQPLGALAFVVCVLLLPVAIWAAVRGENAVAAAMRLPWGRLSWAMLALAGAAWLFKIAVTLTG
jgi:hypothetical protein